MLTLEEFNLIVGLGWDSQWNEKITIFFHEEDGGWSYKITALCNRWTYRLKLANGIQTAHLPSRMTFLLNELKVLLRKLCLGYKDVNAVLPIMFSQDGLEITRGPCRSTKVKSI